MKKRMLCLLVLVLLSVILAGCGNSVKNENELMDDFLVHADNYLVEGSSISEFSVIKRLTKAEDKKDTVYVQMTADHPAATAYQAFIMHYTLYNDGWKLDGIESYQGHDAAYKTVPKSNPTNEEVMTQLTAYSNAAIDDYNQTWQTNDPYFFEEGKYAVRICNGVRSSDQTYECIVMAKRVYNYLVLEEMQKLSFVFDLLRYEWVLYNVEIIDSSGSWYIDGYWREPDSGATVMLEHQSTEVGNGVCMSRFSGSCMPSGNYTDFTLNLYLPSSLGGSGGGLSDYIGGPFEYIYCSIFVHPDELLADRIPMAPLQLTRSVPQLAAVGVIDANTDDGGNEYYEISKALIDSVFIDHDLTYAESVLHPLAREEFLLGVAQLIQETDIQIIDMLHQDTVLFSSGDVNWEYVSVSLRHSFPDATEFAGCSVTLIITENGNMRQEDISVTLLKENDRIYVCGF